MVACLGQRQPRGLAQVRDDRGREAGWHVHAGADGGTAERQFGEARQRVVEPVDAVAYLRRVPGELLTEGDRRGVHEMRAAGFDRVGP
jgi:hypothetical protein